jgi:NADH-quinone oxidoreductase subunit C
MTVALSTQDTTKRVSARFPGAVVETTDRALILTADSLVKVAEYLRSDPDLAFDYLNFLTATDYYEYFEVIYYLTSLQHNHSIILKVRCDRRQPTVPSVYGIWRGADLQERETFDLLGITFDGHPNLKRIVLWEGFDGHPLRKDYVWDSEARP